MPAHQSNCLLLAGVAQCDPRTAQRWLQGQHVHHMIADALARAAQKLGLTVNTTPTAGASLMQAGGPAVGSMLDIGSHTR